MQETVPINLQGLVQDCESHISCEECLSKTECKKFKDVLKNLTEPWEMNRLFEAFKEKE